MCSVEDSENGGPVSVSSCRAQTRDGSDAIGHSGGYVREGGCVLLLTVMS